MKELTQFEVRNIQINILKTIAEYCNQANLRYYLAYGTLLGAVRHKGFIPWDDDIDILLPRSDYEKFTTNFNQYNNEHIVYTSSNDSDYPWPYAKVSHKKTLLIEKSDIKFEKLGVHVDVFPMDGLPDCESKQKKIINSIMRQRNLLNLKSISVSSERVFYKNAILLLGKIALSFFDYRKIIEVINRKATMLSYYESNYVGCIVWNYGYKEVMQKNIFLNECKLEFEGMEFSVPQKYNKFLTNIYGDYMKLPSVEERTTHHSFKAYWK